MSQSFDLTSYKQEDCNKYAIAVSDMLVSLQLCLLFQALKSNFQACQMVSNFHKISQSRAYAVYKDDLI